PARRRRAARGPADRSPAARRSAPPACASAPAAAPPRARPACARAAAGPAGRAAARGDRPRFWERPGPWSWGGGGGRAPLDVQRERGDAVGLDQIDELDDAPVGDAFVGGD